MIETSPKLLSKYEVVRELGRGGMGVVYLAIQRSANKPVAIKVIPVSAFANAELRERFAREIKVMMMLNHPNLIAVVENDTLEDGSPFIVMEYIDGETLDDVRRRGPMKDIKLFASMAKQMLEGLEHAHQKGIIHRDIKPANVMVLSGGTIKVMDFGIAKAEGAQNLTMDRVIGTPAYMSPQQAQGQKIDKRTDIYSLGCLFYAMLAGNPPFGDPSTSPMEMIFKQVNETPPLLSDRAPGTPLPIVQLIHRMLAKNPDERPEGCVEVLKVIDRIEKGTTGGLGETIADAAAVLPRLSEGKLRVGDYVMIEMLVPGLSVVMRGNFVGGLLLLGIGVGIFFTPYQITLSIALRILAVIFTFALLKKKDTVPAIELLWRHRMITCMFVVLLAVGSTFGAFVYETNKRVEAERDPLLEARAAKIEEERRIAEAARIAAMATPAPTPTPEPTPSPTPEPTPIPTPSATPEPTPIPTPIPTAVPSGPSPTPRRRLTDVITITPPPPTPPPTPYRETRATPAPAGDATPTPLPAAALAGWAKDTVASAESLKVAALKAINEDDTIRTEALLNALHGIAQPTPQQRTARVFLTYMISQRDPALYRRQTAALTWKSIDREAGEFVAAMESVTDPAAILYAAEMQLGQPITVSSGFVTRTNMTARFTTPEARERIEAALRSSEPARQVAGLLAARGLAAPELSASIAGLLGYQGTDRVSMALVREGTLSWLEANGTADALPRVRTALQEPPILGNDQARMRALIQKWGGAP